MEYNVWKHRIMGRVDITSRLSHLTRATEDRTAFETLTKILDDRCILGSTTSSGYIVGNTPAVCFQDVPLLSLAENIIYENKLRKDNPKAPVRYEAYGIRVNKQHAYIKGARQVIYGKTDELKKSLRPEDYWMIVCQDFGNWQNSIDWSHEREWRIKDRYYFEYNEIEVIVPSASAYREFISYYMTHNPNLLKEINGIICLDSVIK